jgi:hypothetical protein
MIGAADVVGPLVLMDNDFVASAVEVVAAVTSISTVGYNEDGEENDIAQGKRNKTFRW